MSCPFGFTGLRAAQAMEQAQAARLDGQPQPDNGTNLPTGGASPNRSPSLSPSVASPPTAPLGLFTGGLRTSLGVENAHPLAVWMKEMKARGELKGVDIDEEFRALSQPPIGGDDDLIRQQQDKNWKEKRERPPVEFSSTTSNNNNNNNTNSPTQPGTAIPNGSNPAEWYPGVFSGKIDHNSHAGQSPMVKYDQEITYWNYIFPDVLTSLQNGRQGKGLNHHDEHLFILVHQVFELWFKQILWELEYVRNCLLGYRDPLLPQHPIERNPLARCVQRMNRADAIMRLATEGYRIMETMNPGDFLEFRDFLSPSSGFQSVQLREMEILLGLKDEERIPCAGRHYREAFMANGENKTGVFDRRLKKEKTLKDALYIFLRRAAPSKDLEGFLKKYFSVLQTQNAEKSKDFLEEIDLLEKMLSRATDVREHTYLKELVEKAKFGRTLAANSSEDVAKFFEDPIHGSSRTSVLFLFTYHSHTKLKDAAELVDCFLKFEQSVLLWRQRHARMVEMFIGRRPGTGGSSGVEYIDQTASNYRIFTDLWRIRSLCVARSKIDYDPDTSAQWSGEFMEKFETDYDAIERSIEEEMTALKAKAEAQAASNTPVTSIADGIEPTRTGTAAI